MAEQSPTRSGMRHLVAPELQPWLAVFPVIELTDMIGGRPDGERAPPYFPLPDGQAFLDESNRRHAFAILHNT